MKKIIITSIIIILSILSIMTINQEVENIKKMNAEMNIRLKEQNEKLKQDLNNMEQEMMDQVIEINLLYNELFEN